MTTHSGNEGTVKIGAATVGEIKNFSIEMTADTMEDTAMGDEWRSHKGSFKSWTASIEAHFDTADTGQIALAIGSTVTFNGYATGDGSGAKYLSGSAIVTNRSISTPMDDIVSISMSLLGSGELTEETVSA